VRCSACVWGWGGALCARCVCVGVCVCVHGRALKGMCTVDAQGAEVEERRELVNLLEEADLVPSQAQDLEAAQLLD
jgi:hypothetical protein